MQPSPIGCMDKRSSEEQMRAVRGWVEFLARTGLSAVAKNPTRAQTNSPTGSLAAGLNYLRLAVEEMCVVSLGAARSIVVSTKLECDLESALKIIQPQATLLQEKERMITDREKSISARDEMIAARDNLLAQKNKDVEEALSIIKQTEEVLEDIGRMHQMQVKKHSEDLKAARLTAILDFSTSQLADDCFSEMLGSTLETILINYRSQVCSSFGISNSDVKWEKIDSFLMRDGSLISGISGFSNKFEEFRAEVTAHVSEFIAAYPLPVVELETDAEKCKELSSEVKDAAEIEVDVPNVVREETTVEKEIVAAEEVIEVMSPRVEGRIIGEVDIVNE